MPVTSSRLEVSVSRSSGGAGSIGLGDEPAGHDLALDGENLPRSCSCRLVAEFDAAFDADIQTCSGVPAAAPVGLVSPPIPLQP